MRRDSPVCAVDVKPIGRLDALAAQPVGNSPGEMAAFLQAEMKRWGDLIQEVGVKIQ